jgi:hypothetical protein
MASHRPGRAGCFGIGGLLFASPNPIRSRKDR